MKNQRSTVNRARRACIPCALLLFAAAQQGNAADAVMYGGAAAGENDSIVFLGASIPFQGSNLGQGWMGKYWLDRLRYRYTSGDEVVSASAPGLETAVAYVGGDAQRRYGVALGFTYRYTELSPDQPDSEARGSVWGTKLQLDGGYALTPSWRSSVTAFYDTGASFYWLSGKLLYRFQNNVRLGPELAVFGNPDFRTEQGGLVLSGIGLTQTLQLSLQAYIKKNRGFDAEAALGIGFSRLF